jgi:hypothetical protein
LRVKVQFAKTDEQIESKSAKRRFASKSKFRREFRSFNGKLRLAMSKFPEKPKTAILFFDKIISQIITFLSFLIARRFTTLKKKSCETALPLFRFFNKVRKILRRGRKWRFLLFPSSSCHRRHVTFFRRKSLGSDLRRASRSERLCDGFPLFKPDELTN